MTGKRSYDDGCAAAHALDLIGERWALLVVRELLYGPRRFSDLRESLPSISPNVLSQRLKDLEHIGVIHRHQLPPPAGSWVYELTPWGGQLEPILQQLGRWGVQSPTMPLHAPISVATGLSAMNTMFSPAAAQGLELSIVLQLGAEIFTVGVRGAQLSIMRGEVGQPDARITGDINRLRDVIFGGMTLAEAEAEGWLSVAGNGAVAQRFTALFPLGAG